MSPTMKTIYNLCEIKAIFRKYVKDNFRFPSDAARYFGVSDQYMEMVMKDKYNAMPNATMLETIGFKREVRVFSKIKR